MVSKFFVKSLIVLGISISFDGYCKEFSFENTPMSALIKTGNNIIYLTPKEKKPGERPSAGFAISSINKNIKAIEINMELWTAEKFNQRIYDKFLSLSQPNIQEQFKKNIINIHQSFDFNKVFFRVSHEIDPFKQENYSFDTDSSSTIAVLKGDQNWTDELVVGKGDMYLVGTKFQLRQVAFGFADRLVFEAPSAVDTDIRQIVFTKAPGAHYLYITGEIDFSKPDLFIQTESPFFISGREYPFVAQGAQKVEFFVDPKKIESEQ